MNTIEIVVSEKLDKEELVKNLTYKALDACRSRAERLRFIVNGMQSATVLPKIIRYLKSRADIKIELVDGCGVLQNAKLVKVFKLCGVANIIKMKDSNEMAVDPRFMGLFSLEEIKRLPQNYLSIETTKIADVIEREAKIRIATDINVPLELAQRIIPKLVGYDINSLSFEGAEPTVVERLPLLIKLAKNAGINRVSLHSDGIRLAELKFLDELIAAGLDTVFLSLSSSRAEITEAIDDAEQRHKKVLDSFENLIEREINVVVCCLINSSSLSGLPEFAQYISEMAEKYNTHPAVKFAISSPQDNSPEAFEQHSPTVKEMCQPLQDTISILLEHKIEVQGFGSPYGPALCVLGELIDSFTELPDIEQNNERDFVKSGLCAKCRYDRKCYGLRRADASDEVLKELLPYK